MALTQVAAGASKDVTIQDYIGVNWEDELVHYPMTFKPGELTGRAVARVTVQGGQAISSQVSDVVRYDDASVRSMNVWFMTSVPADKAVSYTITPGVEGPATPGVSVKSTARTLELTTLAPRPIGIRLVNGVQQYDWPVEAAKVPGPVQALLLASGRTTGKGRFEVPFLVKSYRTELLADGPLFAEARVHYVFDTGYWTFTVRVIKGCPMMVANEEFNNGFSKQKWSDFDRFYSLVLNGGDFKAVQGFYTGRTDKPELSDLLKQSVNPVWLKNGRVRSNWFCSEVNGYTPKFDADRTVYHLTGYPSVLARVGCLARYVEPGKDAIGLAALEPMGWRNPLSIRFRENKKGELLVSLPLQVYEEGWASDGFGRNSPNYTGKTLYVPDHTARRRYGIMLTPAENDVENKLASLFALGAKLSCHPLDQVKDYVLDWPDPMAKAKWAAKSSKAGSAALTLMRERIEFFRMVGHYGIFSMGYHYGFSKGHYPGIQNVIDSPKDLSAADRRELRRLCAFNAYDMNSLDTFPWGSGVHLNNPNMSIMAMEARAKSSLLVKDHPMFKPWGEWTLAFTRGYVRRFTRDSGALYENAHYSLGVTLGWSGQVNRILMDNGVGDALDTPLFRKSMRFVMDWLTPPDPRFKGHRVIIPMGNCSYQSVPPGFANQYVEYFKDRYPKLAGELQWFANQTLPDKMKIKIVKDIVPELKSTNYDEYGVYFRHGFGTPYETMMLLYAGDCDGHYEWEQDQMSYTLYAKGQPINLHFGNGYFPMFCRPWLRNRVSIDHKFEMSERNVTKVETAAFTPETEYARAMRRVDQIRALKTEYPLTAKGRWLPEESLSWPQVPDNIEQIPPVVWYRQILFVKDKDPRGPNYFVIHDGFGGLPTRPTDVSYWFLANKMTRKGDVFHFDGQCKVDMDVFVNTPASPRVETGHYGHQQQPYRRFTGFDPRFFPGGKRWEEQLVLRVKQPAGKGYMVVLYPRLKEGDPAAAFTRLSDSVVKVETPLSTDYALVAPYPFEFKDATVQFKGLAAAVRFYKDGTVTVTNSEGDVSATVVGKTITGTGPFVVTLKGGKATSKTFGKDARVTVK